MDKAKAKRAKMEIDEVLEEVSKGDWRDPKVTEHMKNLAKLHEFYEKECLKDEIVDYSMRGASMAYGSMRNVDPWSGIDRRTDGRSTVAESSYRGVSYGMDCREQMRQMMLDPSLTREAKEYLRKAMETIC